MTVRKQFDVVIVGASVGGCTAATLYARRGLSVALLERTNDDEHYKKLCTHFIQPGAVGILQKLGLDKKIEAAGGVRNQLEAWTQWGWLRASGPAAVGYGYNIRRQTLDPLLRAMAVETPGVEYFPGTSANSLLRDGQGRIAGVAVKDGKTEFVAPLVIAADGRNSRLAEMADIPAKSHPNERFNFFTYYRGLSLRSDCNSRYWHLHPNMAYAFHNEDNTTLLGISLPHSQMAEFRKDITGNFRKFWAEVPDAPNLDGAESASEMRGIMKLDNSWRPASVPGMALIGDSATVLDPIWGTGCCFAFQAADWLVDLTAPCLADPHHKPRDMDRLLQQYREMHRARTRGHYWHIASFAKIRDMMLSERILFSAATRDTDVADCILRYLGRTHGITHLGSPSGLWRAMMVNLGLVSPPERLSTFPSRGRLQISHSDA